MPVALQVFLSVLGAVITVGGLVFAAARWAGRGETRAEVLTDQQRHDRDTTRQNVAEIKSTVTDLKHEVEKRFDRIELRLDKDFGDLERKVDAFAERVVRLEAHLPRKRGGG